MRSLLSLPLPATIASFPEKTTAVTLPPKPVSVATSRPLAKFQTFTLRSSEPVAAYLPSRLTAMQRAIAEWPVGAPSDFGSSKSRTALSTAQEATFRPSGLKAALVTQPVCPRSTRISLFVVASQMRTTPSAPPLMRNLPSFE